MSKWIPNLKRYFSLMILINEENYKLQRYKNIKYILNEKIKDPSDYHLLFAEKRQFENKIILNLESSKYISEIVK